MDEHPKTTVGLHRSKSAGGQAHTVRIRDADGTERDVSEQCYRENGYQPFFEQLAWWGEPGSF
jgi:hypothetical protein